MENEFDNLPAEQRISAENDFLKMKMMLENGAQFGGMEKNSEFTPEMENLFLRNVMEFESLHENAEQVTVFERIGKPAHFKEETTMSDPELDAAWQEINELLVNNFITLDCCSPNVSKRELYRFAITELFEQKVEKIPLPGWFTTFTYDEFHPDPLYENTNVALEECRQILEKDDMQWLHNFQKENLRLNDHFPLTENQFQTIVNRFKAAYESLSVEEIKEANCTVDEKESIVEGVYKVDAMAGGDKILLAGSWQVFFQLNELTGYWYISNVQIKGIDF